MSSLWHAGDPSSYLSSRLEHRYDDFFEVALTPPEHSDHKALTGDCHLTFTALPCLPTTPQRRQTQHWRGKEGERGNKPRRVHPPRFVWHFGGGGLWHRIRFVQSVLGLLLLVVTTVSATLLPTSVQKKQNNFRRVNILHNSNIYCLEYSRFKTSLLSHPRNSCQ